MADEQDLKDALAGEKDLASFDLSGADLSGHDFTGCYLDNCRLEDANLRGANFKSCDLRRTVLHNANFSEANLISAKFFGAVMFVDFSHADLSNSNFSTCVFHGCNFSYAKLNNADFSESVFQEENTFVDAKANSNTKFNNVEMHRALSKDPVFSEYEYSRGRLHRKTDGVARSKNFTMGSSAIGVDDLIQESSKNTSAETVSKNITTGLAVGQRLATKPDAYSTQLNELAEWMSEQIEWWESKKPNHDDAEWIEHYEFLKKATETLNELSKMVASLSDESKDSDIELAGKNAIAARNTFQKWTDDFIEFAGSSGKSIGMLSIITGATFALSTIVGSEPTLTLGIVSAAVGGRDLAENIGKATGKS